MWRHTCRLITVRASEVLPEEVSEGGGTLNYSTDLRQQIRDCVIYSVWKKKEAVRYLACHIFQVEENSSMVDFHFNDMPPNITALTNPGNCEDEEWYDCVHRYVEKVMSVHLRSAVDGFLKMSHHLLTLSSAKTKEQSSNQGHAGRWRRQKYINIITEQTENCKTKKQIAVLCCAIQKHLINGKVSEQINSIIKVSPHRIC